MEKINAYFDHAATTPVAEIKLFSNPREVAGTSSIAVSTGISVDEAMNEMLGRSPELKIKFMMKTAN